jgi:hypothetical protein
MTRFLPSVVCVLCLLLGLSVGWYFGFTRPTRRDQEKLLKEYRYVRDNFHMTDAEMADFGEHQAEYLNALKRQDEMAAVIALGALVKIEQGDIATARSRLEKTISIYYRGHRDDGDSNVLRHITTFAATNAALSNTIYRKLN